MSLPTKRMLLEEKCYYENAYDVGEIDGANKKAESIALNMLKENIDINLISKLTNLSKEKILLLKNKNVIEK